MDEVLMGWIAPRCGGYQPGTYPAPGQDDLAEYVAQRSHGNRRFRRLLERTRRKMTRTQIVDRLQS